MSYYKCKGISRKGNKIEVNVASSNCFPITYFKSEYKQRENQETLFWLYVDIEQGNIHLNSSLYNYIYAMEKVREYQTENNIDSYNDLYKKSYDYYNEQFYVLTRIDLAGDYWKDKELEDKVNKYNKEYEKELETLRYESYMKVYGACYEVFKSALDEKEDNTLYTLYSDTYKYIKLKGSNGAFYYGYSSAVEKGKYKEMYVKAKIVGRDIQVKRVVLTDKEIQKELENEQLKEQAKEKIKDVEQVKKDLAEFKNNRFDIDKYYLQEICRLFNIKEYRSTKNITIPKNLIHIAKNSYKFTGKHSRKMSAKIDYIREELLKVVENV